MLRRMGGRRLWHFGGLKYDNGNIVVTQCIETVLKQLLQALDQDCVIQRTIIGHHYGRMHGLARIATLRQRIADMNTRGKHSLDRLNCLLQSMLDPRDQTSALGRWRVDERICRKQIGDRLVIASWQPVPIQQANRIREIATTHFDLEAPFPKLLFLGLDVMTLQKRDGFIRLPLT
ncbi:hypothetical protein RO07_25220 [Pandoraea pulmonicola]|uniref:Uncharacterized protein n=1 Tax=Pandoraea pulmonicola TaxID=93221 RepID=A0ABM6FRZ7_PANPU|nr:hypothetical protein RO07_25220 [Pandoraea pulmonicola]